MTHLVGGSTGPRSSFQMMIHDEEERQPGKRRSCGRLESEVLLSALPFKGMDV